MPDLLAQIYARAKPPFLTLINGQHSESQFVVLRHLEAILLNATAAKGIFDDEYRQFYVRWIIQKLIITKLNNYNNDNILIIFTIIILF
jgi:hypothetical protein